MSDITLMINTNKNIPNKFFRFHDAFPINLGVYRVRISRRFRGQLFVQYRLDLLITK